MVPIRRNRRQVLKGVGRIASIGVVGQWGGLAIGRSSGADIAALAAIAPDKRFVEAAHKMQRRAIDAGDQAFGAVVVKDGRIVGEGPSWVITNHDATAHAEMEAIRDASRRLGTRDLSGCVMYSTFQPCPMCETAAYWAKVSQLYHGGAPADGGAPRYGRC